MGESLTHYVKKPNMNMKMKASILYEVAFGLNYLHSYNPPIIHRDLSPNNVLMSRDFVKKISDLGVAKVVRTDNRVTQTMLTKAPGTVDFMHATRVACNWPWGNAKVWHTTGYFLICWNCASRCQPRVALSYQPHFHRSQNWQTHSSLTALTDRISGELNLLFLIQDLVLSIRCIHRSQFPDYLEQKFGYDLALAGRCCTTYHIAHLFLTHVSPWVTTQNSVLTGLNGAE